MSLCTGLGAREIKSVAYPAKEGSLVWVCRGEGKEVYSGFEEKGTQEFELPSKDQSHKRFPNREGIYVVWLAF